MVRKKTYRKLSWTASPASVHSRSRSASLGRFSCWRSTRTEAEMLKIAYITAVILISSIHDKLAINFAFDCQDSDSPCLHLFSTWALVILHLFSPSINHLYLCHNFTQVGDASQKKCMEQGSGPQRTRWDDSFRDLAKMRIGKENGTH